jgi:HSP20 family protein
MYLVPVTRHPAAVFRHFDRLFDDVFGPAARADAKPAPRVPALDVAETDTAYTVTLDMPGVAKELLDVSIDGKLVKVEARAQSDEAQKDGDRVVYRERAVSHYARSFRLAVEIDQAASTAKLDNGVLTLTLVKRVAASAAKLTIQ